VNEHSFDTVESVPYESAIAKAGGGHYEALAEARDLHVQDGAEANSWGEHALPAAADEEEVSIRLEHFAGEERAGGVHAEELVSVPSHI